MFQRVLLFAAGCLALLGTQVDAQSNIVPGLDIQYGFITDFDNFGDDGPITGFAAETTICNPGSVNIPWFAPMNPNHSTFAFIICRDSGDRFEQISDRSYIKHPFTALSSSQCTPCSGSGGGTSLGIGCSDTYWAGLNADRYYLAPPDEVDPWLGTWESVGSHFDRGVLNPNNPTTCCDGVRTLTNSQVNTMTSAENLVRVHDSEFQQGGTFYYGGYIVSPGEDESLRFNNSRHRRFNANFTGSTYNPNPVGGQQSGVILNRWAAKDRIDSNTNGTDDGRIFVAMRATGPFFGLYHYEYAVQNRDNTRGMGSFSIPKCPDARILNASFRDIDDVASNDWSVAVNASDVTFTSNEENGLFWNSIYNFSFDSDAAPAEVAATLGAEKAGPGADSFTVLTNGPSNLQLVYLGDGCSNVTPPSLFSNKVPTIGNSEFRLLCDGAEPGSTQFLYSSATSGSTVFAGCDVYFGGAFYLQGIATVNTNGRGIYQTPIPADTSLEGIVISAQTAGFRSTGGPLFGSFELSNGLQIRIGDNLSGCP